MSVRTPVTEHRGRLIVAERSANACELCGREGLGVHHRVKAGQGGAWSPANLLRLCGSGTTGCHGRIEHNPAAARLLGLWLNHGTDPTTAPMLCKPRMWWAAWWLAEDDGTWKYERDATEAELQLLAAITT